MAWTTPPTYTVGQTVTAANLNTYIRDNSNFLYGLVFTPPGAKSHRSTDIGISNASWESHQLDTQDYDTDSMSNTGTGTFTCNTSGAFLCIGTAMFGNNNTGIRQVRLDQNTGTIISINQDNAPSSTINCSIAVSGIQQFSASGGGDTLTVDVYQTSGGSLDVLGSNPPVGYSLAMAWIGDF